jgi:pilus assembly protein CpaC
VNLLNVNVPASEPQILLKVQFATIDRAASLQLGANLFSLGGANTIGRTSTEQFSPPTVTQSSGQTTSTLSDALNIFLFRPDLNLGATIEALQTHNDVQILAEPNVLAINNKPASFLAGGEFPYPILQGGGAGLGTVTVAFREFGVRLGFLPLITPRGTIRLSVVPEVSALDYASGLTIQGFNIPGLTVRRVQTEIELGSGQSFAIAGLMDKSLTQTIEKIPLLSQIPLLGKLFQSKLLNKSDTELLVIVTPQIVNPIPAGQPLPQLNFPWPFMTIDKPSNTSAGGPAAPPLPPATPTMPFEALVRDMQAEADMKLTQQKDVSTWPTSQQTSVPGSLAPKQ